eukprot:CAMPEP_0113938128 /NCGR_PEP_ID=MMETSP1339-20121228/4527_1 /TAXON_ID=94617 /ORGANISM="Fibrocapsa japonica" /LENGTH=303 /DNA_ID=CAMNT_0000941079 /DNA_START=44 /DNA_END=952 /DNA_ORIENTATION=+ /assembly_acc=CAM_ASM_000762
MESTPEQKAEGKATIRVLACVLNKLIEANERACCVGNQVTKFHALEPPQISLFDYLERIQNYSCCSNECFVLALIYIDRLIQRNSFALTSLNIHRVVITSIMLAAKFFDDHYFNNAYYAKVGGVPAAEMNSLEVELLFRIKFSLHVTSDVFTKYQKELGRHMPTDVWGESAGMCSPEGSPVGAEAALDSSLVSFHGSFVPISSNNDVDGSCFQYNCQPGTQVQSQSDPAHSFFGVEESEQTHYQQHANISPTGPPRLLAVAKPDSNGQCNVVTADYIGDSNQQPVEGHPIYSPQEYVQPKDYW